MKTRATVNNYSRSRALHGYGIELSKKLRQQIIAEIQNEPPGGRQLVHFVRRRSCEVTVWEVTIDNQTFRILYDKRRAAIADVLPRSRR